MSECVFIVELVVEIMKITVSSFVHSIAGQLLAGYRIDVYPGGGHYQNPNICKLQSPPSTFTAAIKDSA